jgi:hypothetical protein
MKSVGLTDSRPLSPHERFPAPLYLERKGASHVSIIRGLFNPSTFRRVPVPCDGDHESHCKKDDKDWSAGERLRSIGVDFHRAQCQGLSRVLERTFPVTPSGMSDTAESRRDPGRIIWVEAPYA